jgi:hypothetical protein
MTAVSAQLPSSFGQPFNLLNGDSHANRDSGTLHALLAEPLEFKETATVVTSLDPGQRGWIEVNPLPKVSSPITQLVTISHARTSPARFSLTRFDLCAAVCAVC